LHVLLFDLAPGIILPTLPNGSLRYPSLGDASSHPSTRHPSVGSTCLPSLGEESTHPLLAAEEAVRVGGNGISRSSRLFFINN